MDRFAWALDDAGKALFGRRDGRGGAHLRPVCVGRGRCRAGTVGQSGESYRQRFTVAPPEYLLTGLVRCSRCQRRYVGVAGSGSVRTMTPVVELRGIEPLTSTMPWWRSTN